MFNGLDLYAYLKIGGNTCICIVTVCKSIHLGNVYLRSNYHAKLQRRACSHFSGPQGRSLSCLDAFCILLLAALVIDLCCLPCVLTPWSHQLGHAVEFNNVILYFPCTDCCACLAAQLGCLGKSVAATVAVFVMILQLYLVKTQARPTPVPAGQ